MSSNSISGPGSTAGLDAVQNFEYSGEGRVTFDNGSSMSVMEAVSFLFMERSEVFSKLANDRMQASQQNLKDIKEAREMLAEMRHLKESAKHGGSKHCTEMDQKMKDWCDRNGVDTRDVNDDNKHNSSEWDVIIERTQGKLDTLTDSNQMQFLKLKSSVNKLDESLSAANKQVDKNHDGIKGILSR